MEDANSSTASIIGRDAEIEKLRGIFNDAMAGNGRTVLLSGPAGIGKSRMVEELAKWAAEAGATFVSGTCSPTSRSEPYQPFRQALRTLGSESILGLEDMTCFDELFLISSIGLLITHISRKEAGGVDEDILSSMLTAVQDFVKDSFGDGGMQVEDGGLGRLEYRNKKVMIEHGQYVFLAGVVSGQEHHRMRDDLRRMLRDIEKDFAEHLTDWDGDLDKVAGSRDYLQKLVDSRYPVKKTLASMNIDAARLEVQEGIQGALASNSEAGLVLAIEDIHNADETSLLAIPFLARNMAPLRTLICVTYEPEGPSANLKKALEIMRLESTAEAMEMAGLQEEDVQALIASKLGDGDIPEDLVRHLISEGGGNPLFTLELLRTLRASNILTYEDDIWIFRDRLAEKLPSSVADMVSRQMEELDIDGLRVLEFSSVLGMEVEPQIISIGAEMDLVRVEKILKRLADTNFLVMSDNRYRFKHGTVQDAVYSGLSPHWKRVLHLSAGTSLEFAYEYDIDSVLFLLAHHFARTNAYEKGIDYSIEAGEMAVSTNSPGEAIDFFVDALGLMEEFEIRHPRNLEISMMLSELYELDGQYDRAIDISNTAREMCDDCGTIAAIEKRLGFVYLSKSDYQNSIKHFEAAIEQAKEAGDELLLASCYGGLGKVYLRKGDYDRSLEYQQNYLDTARSLGDIKEIGQAYMNLGGVYWHKSDYEAANKSWLASLEAMKEAKNELGTAYVLNNLGVVNDTRGNLDEAMTYYSQCIEIKKKLGDVRGTAMAHNNLGIIHKEMGEFREAIANYNKSLEIRHRIGDMNGMANAYNNLGSCYIQLENFEKAADYFRKYRAVVERIDDTWGISQALSNLSEAEYALGNLDDAFKHGKMATEMAAKHDFKDVLAPACGNLGLAQAALGEWAPALKNLNRGIVVAEETGESYKRGTAHLQMAKAYLLKGDNDMAKEHLTKALEIFEDASIRDMAEKTRMRLANLRR